MNLIADAWLSQHLGREVFRVDAAGGSSDPAVGVLAHRDAHPAAMYYAKVATTDIAAVRALSRAGFYVVDVNVTFARQRTATAPRAPRARGVTIAAVTGDTSRGALDIAGSAFRYTRFHLDPAIPIASAHRVKRAWIESYVARTRGDRLLVGVDDDGTVVGFLAALLMERGGAPVAVIDLIGVRTDHQRCGAGTSLVDAFCEHYADRCDRYEVGTQAANVPSLQFYHRLGFQIASTTYVLHMHAPAAR